MNIKKFTVLTITSSILCTTFMPLSAHATIEKKDYLKQETVIEYVNLPW